MSTENNAVMKGVQMIEAWAQARFPEATVNTLGPVQRMPRYRWTIDFGPDKAALRLRATDGVLASPRILEQRLGELAERASDTQATDNTDNWMMLNLVEVVLKKSDEW
jgi:hypothetical protein